MILQRQRGSFCHSACLADHSITCSMSHFLPEVHTHTPSGRGHDLEVSLYRFIVSLWSHFLLPCISTEPWFGLFFKGVHKRTLLELLPSSLINHLQAVNPQYTCVKKGTLREPWGALRDALRDNCLTILRDLLQLLMSCKQVLNFFLIPCVSFCDFFSSQTCQMSTYKVRLINYL